jgi:DNA repair exonuclease SbcCD ATPase subunit
MIDIELTNFGIFQGTHKISLDGLSIIQGDNKDIDTADSNMAGKTTIIDAIMWCLFGETSKGLSKDAVINWNEKEAQVSIFFDNDISIMRNKKRSKSEHVIVWEGDLSDPTCTTYCGEHAEQFIQSWIGFHKHLFMCSHVISKESLSKKFLLATPAERTKLLELMVDVSWIDKMKTKAQQKYSTLSSEVNTLETSISLTRQELSNTQLKLQTLAQDYTKDYRRLSIEQEAKLIELRAELQTASDTGQDLEQQHSLVLSHLREAQQMVRNTQEQIDAYFTYKICPTCGSALEFSEKDKEELQNGLARYKHMEQSHSLKQYELSEKIRRRRETIMTLQVSVSKQEQALSATVALLESQNTLQGHLEEEIARYKGEIKSYEDCLTRAYHELQLVTYWRQACNSNGLRSIVLDVVRETLNTEINHWLPMFLPGYQFLMPITEKSEMKLEIKNPDGRVVPLEGMSSGELWRLNIPVLLGIIDSLTKGSGGLSLICLDDILSDLDDTGIEATVKLLENILKERYEHVVVTIPRNILPATHTIVREQGKSYIKEGV